MKYNFYGWETAEVQPINNTYPSINSPRDLYDALSEIWCAETCAPRMRDKWTPDNKTLGQCSITAFLAQDIFGGKVYGILRDGGNYHCYNVIGDCVFDLTSEQFGDEKLVYENNTEQLREIHFAKEEKCLRYEFLKKSLSELYKMKSMVDTSKSSSHEQQNAEVHIASKVEEWLGCPVERNAKAVLSDDGVHIEPDLYSEKDRVICEIFVHIGSLKSGQKRKISQDILKMLLLEKIKNTTYRKVIVVADDKVEKYLNGKSIIAESIRRFGIEIKRINLSEKLHTMISDAQDRQTMQ